MQGMLVGGVLLLITLACDLLMFGAEIMQLAHNGFAEVLAVSVSFALVAALLLWIAIHFRQAPEPAKANHITPPYTAAAPAELTAAENANQRDGLV